VHDHEAYRVWNMGQGLLLITPQPEAAITVASSHGLTAQIIGVMTPQPGLRLHNRGYFHADEPVLCYDA
jgi:phosphoribosylaminoimidazole (AIR) synthetase